jgi:hypothetical protein
MHLRTGAAAFLLALSPIAVLAQAPPAPAPTVASVMDRQLTMLEKQFVPAAEAMPAAQYNYVPFDGEGGVRSFALQVRHVAAANFAFYSILLGQPLPRGVDLSGPNNGPEDLQSKEQILQYLNDSFALGHKAMASLTAANLVTPIPSPIPSFNTRLFLASFGCSHAWDHYGQMVEYLRANGITPPASQGQPPANPAKK